MYILQLLLANSFTIFKVDPLGMLGNRGRFIMNEIHTYVVVILQMTARIGASLFKISGTFYLN